jgi:DNA polymerase-3 subunit delta'
MWHGIYGHDAIVERFRRTIESRRLASTYLFVGLEGVGKRSFSLQLAKALLCTASVDSELDACGRCESCRLFAAGNHPDLEFVGLPRDKSKLPIELFIGDRDHRHREGLCHRIAMKPFLASRKIAIIDDADHFNQESANCLLKLLEEPPPRSLLVLIGTSLGRQLPTIRSRAQVVHFQPLDAETVARILSDRGLVTDPDQAKVAARLSEGSVARALELAEPGLWNFRERLFSELPHTMPVRLARLVQAFVDEAGKETWQKRDRLRHVIGFAIDFHRDALRNAYAGFDAERTVHALDSSLGALEHIDRNANLSLVIQQWSDDLR